MIYGEIERTLKVIDSCENCNANLYGGGEVVIDNCGVCYCDFDCAFERFGIEEVTESDDVVTCENCCETLDFGFETFKDCDDDYYCSKECINNLYGLEIKTLEYMEE